MDTTIPLRLALLVAPRYFYTTPPLHLTPPPLCRFSLQGVQKYREGDVYSGSFRNGLREGNGVLQFKEGGEYEGIFEAGEPVGLKVEVRRRVYGALAASSTDL